MQLMKKAAQRIADTPFGRKALEEEIDPALFRKKPSGRVCLGLFLMGFSYVIGWPAISALGILAVLWKKPLVAVIGGPVLYGISHLVFMAGLYLAGSQYATLLMRWGTRRAIEKLLGDDPVPGRIP